MDNAKKEYDVSKFFTIALDMMCIAGPDGYLKLVNKMFPKILGYAEEEFYNKPFIDFVHPDDKEKTINEIQKLSQGLPTVNFDNRYLGSDGLYRWISWNAILGDDGLIYAIARDTTSTKNESEVVEKKAAEYEELNKLMVGRELKMAELKKKIGELEAQLAQFQQASQQNQNTQQVKSQQPVQTPQNSQTLPVENSSL